MPWQRNWDGCKVYSSWTKDGVLWSIQDVLPEEDEVLIELMLKHFLPEAPMAMRLDLHKDESSLEAVKKFWAKGLSQRSSLVCYCHSEGQKEIAAVNICPVVSTEDTKIEVANVEPEKARILVATLDFVDRKADVFKSLGVTHYLSGSGLFVLPKHRGNRLGAKVLDAREPMCRSLGIPATVTLFTGPASQKLAEGCGFQKIFDITFQELSDSGFHYPGDQTKILKMMYKKYI